MEQEKKFDAPFFIIARYFKIDSLRFDKIVHTADVDALENALSVTKMLSNTQPGIFILFQYPQYREWIDKERVEYYPVSACKDGLTVDFTNKQKYFENPESQLIYTECGLWMFKIDDIVDAMSEDKGE